MKIKDVYEILDILDPTGELRCDGYPIAAAIKDTLRWLESVKVEDIQNLDTMIKNACGVGDDKSVKELKEILRQIEDVTIKEKIMNQIRGTINTFVDLTRKENISIEEAGIWKKIRLIFCAIGLIGLTIAAFTLTILDVTGQGGDFIEKNGAPIGAAIGCIDLAIGAIAFAVEILDDLKSKTGLEWRAIKNSTGFTPDDSYIKKAMEPPRPPALFRLFNNRGNNSHNKTNVIKQ